MVADLISQGFCSGAEGSRCICAIAQIIVATSFRTGCRSMPPAYCILISTPLLPSNHNKAPPIWVVLYYGGAEGSRTPVRKQLDKTFYGRSLLFTFPFRSVSKHTRRISSFMMHGTGKAYRTHVHHSDHTRARLVVLPGRMGA